MTNVILLETVYKKGKAGEVIDVKPGFARNYLIPFGKAVRATPANIRKFKEEAHEVSKSEAARLEVARKVAVDLESGNIEIVVRSSTTDRIFGSITARALAREIARQVGVEISIDCILLSNPIRSTGSFRVQVRVHPQVFATVKVLVSTTVEGLEQLALDELNTDERKDLAYSHLEELSAVIAGKGIQDASAQLGSIAAIVDDAIGLKAREALYFERGEEFTHQVQTALDQLDVTRLIGMELVRDIHNRRTFHFRTLLLDALPVRVGNVRSIPLSESSVTENADVDISVFSPTPAHYTEQYIEELDLGLGSGVAVGRSVEFTEGNEDDWKLWVMLLVDGDCVHRKLWTLD